MVSSRSPLRPTASAAVVEAIESMTALAESVSNRRALYMSFLPDKSFGRRYNYDQHMLTREKKIRKNGYKCSECDKRFVRKTDLARHHKSQHTLGEDGGYKCPLCDKALPANGHLAATPGQ
jgi:DNA-directed RNA polymerase subunit RPC12/RpoP